MTQPGIGMYPYGFPVPPYDVQTNLMDSLYTIIQQGDVGILESPTGTGKSLSIICGCLTWLHDEERRIIQGELKATSDSTPGGEDLPDWVTEHGLNAQRTNAISRLRARQTKLGGIKDRFRKQRMLKPGKPLFGNKPKHKSSAKADAALDSLILDECSDDGDGDKVVTQKRRRYYGDSSDSDDQKGGSDSSSSKSTDDGRFIPKIIYCTRTHSQLDQIVEELQKTAFSSNTTVVVFGSRKTMCVNPQVLALSSATAIRDKCLDLQQKKAKRKNSSSADGATALSGKGCPYMSQHDNRLLRDRLVSNVTSIEEAHEAGKSSGACPYYSARSAIKYAQMVLLPYNCLVQRGIRESLGISLRNHVVIFDEAHNLVDVINSSNSVGMRRQQILAALSATKEYLGRYRERLSTKNQSSLRQLVFVLEHLAQVILLKKNSASAPEGRADDVGPFQEILTTNELLFRAGIDHINFPQVVRFMRNSGLSKKLISFVKAFLCDPSSGEGSTQGSALYEDRTVIQTAELFLEALAMRDEDGRILLTYARPHQGDAEGGHTTEGTQPGVKFLILNPALHFREIVDDARSVVLLGGTMTPVDSTVHSLFASLPPGRIHIKSYGHVIDKDHLSVVTLTGGPLGTDFHFTHENQSNAKLLDDVGRALVNLSKVVPGGVVVFLPSYKCENAVFVHLQRSGVIAAIAKKKKVFREPKSTSELATVMLNYRRCVEDGKEPGSEHTGGILFSVVGGKLSEGINFSDDLGRCVVMVGLPFPSRYDLELQERMAYLNRQVGFNRSCSRRPDPHGTVRSDSEVGTDGSSCQEGRPARPTAVGDEYYMNLCMRAVNQSIGRAIRHKNDYAAIVLFDRRYRRDDVLSRLPHWMRPSVSHPSSFGTAFREIAQFFRSRGTKDNSCPHKK
eukprot:Rmarinus@m.15946